MDSPPAPRHILFDPTPEIFATDAGGAFLFPLQASGVSGVDSTAFDEVRFVVSIWHPSAQRTIDLDKAYAELRGCFDPNEERWVKLAEVEPIVPPYGSGDSFDGWLVLPVLASQSTFALFGSGFEARSRLQIRVGAYFVP